MSAPQWLWVVSGWLICGFLAYGLDKGKHRDFLRHAKLRVSDGEFPDRDEIRHWLIAVMGPVWLAATFLGIGLNCLMRNDWRFWRQLGFCLRMPKDLK